MGKHYAKAQIHGIRRWTRLSYGCFIRRCRCGGCDLIPEYLIEQCRVKSSVIELVRMFGVPEEKDTESEVNDAESTGSDENSEIS